MSRPILELNDVHAAYLRKEILRGVSLTVGAGEIVAILGENGAGKSTALKVVAGLLRPSNGTVHFQGKPLDSLDIAQRQRLGVGYLMQGGRVFPNLTVQENHDLAVAEARRVGRTPSPLGEWFPLLCERRADRAGLLSGGQRQMLAIELVLAQRPELLLLDEPTAALSADGVNVFISAIRQLARNGSTAAILVEQNPVVAGAVATRSLSIQRGTL